LELAREIIALAEEVGDPERAFAGRENLFHAAWQLGDMTTAAAQLGALEQLAATLRQPPQLWLIHAIRAKIALAEGRFADAEQAIEAAYGYGRAAQSWNAEVTYQVQTF